MNAYSFGPCQITFLDYSSPPQPWVPPSGWMDQPPPQNRFLLIQRRSGRVLGTCNPYALQPGRTYLNVASHSDVTWFRLSEQASEIVPLQHVHLSLIRVDVVVITKAGDVHATYRWAGFSPRPSSGLGPKHIYRVVAGLTGFQMESFPTDE
jgi:hypothetical protein